MASYPWMGTRGSWAVVLAVLLYTIPMIRGSVRADFEDQVNCLDCNMATSTVTRTRAGGFTVSPDHAGHGRTLVGHSRGVVFGKETRFHEPGVQLSFQGDVLLKDHTSTHDYSAVTGSSGESILITGKVRHGMLLNAPVTEPGFADTLRHNDTFTWQQVMGDWAFTENGLYTPGSVQSNVIWIGPRPSWQDYRVTARITLESSSGEAGILFQASSQDAVNLGGQQYYAGLDAAGNQVVLSRYNGGSESVKSTTSMGIRFGHEYTLSVLVREGSIVVKVDGRTELTHKDASTYTGSIGLRSSFVGAHFSSIVVSSPQDAAQVEGWSPGPSQLVLAWPGFEKLGTPVLSVQQIGVTPACETEVTSLFAIIDCPTPLLIAHDAPVNFDFVLSGGRMSQSSLSCTFMGGSDVKSSIDGSRQRDDPYNLHLRAESKDARKGDGLSFYSVVVGGETQSTSHTGESLNFTVPPMPGTYSIHTHYVTPVCTGANTDGSVVVVPPIEVRAYQTDGGNSLNLEWNPFPSIAGYSPTRHVIMILELDDQGNVLQRESSDFGGSGVMNYNYNGVYSGARYKVWVDAQYSGADNKVYAVSQPLSIWLPPSYNICPHKAGMDTLSDLSNLPEALLWLQPESGIIDHSSTQVSMCPGPTHEPTGPLPNDKKEYAGVRMFGRTRGGLAINGTYTIDSNANMTLVLTFKPGGPQSKERPLLLSESGMITIGNPTGCAPKIRYEDTPGSFICGSGTPSVLWNAWNVLEIHHKEGGRHYVYLNGFLSHNTSTFSWFTTNGILVGSQGDSSYSLSDSGFTGEIGEFYIYNAPGDDADANAADTPNPTWITTSYRPLLQNAPSIWYSPPDDLDARYDVGGIHKNQLYDAPIYSAELVILRSALQDNGVMLAGHNFRGDPQFVQTMGAPPDMLVFQRHWWIEGQNLNAAETLTVQMFSSRNWFSENTEVRLLTRPSKHLPWTDTGSNPTYRTASGVPTTVDTSVIVEFTLPSGPVSYAGYYTFAIKLAAVQPGEGIHLESVPWRGRASKTHGRGSVFHFDSQSLDPSDARREVDGLYCLTSWSPLISDSMPNIQGLLLGIVDNFFFKRTGGTLSDHVGVDHWDGSISTFRGGFAPPDAPNTALTFVYTTPGGGLAEEILICWENNDVVLQVEMGGNCRLNVTTPTESVCSGTALNSRQTHVYTVVDEASTLLYEDSGLMVSASSQMLGHCNLSLANTHLEITGPLQGFLGDMIWTQGLDDSTVVSHNLGIKYDLPFVGFTPPSTQFRHGAASLYRGGNAFLRDSAYSYELSVFDINFLSSMNRWANVAADYGAESNHTQLTRADLDQDGSRGVVMRLARSWFISFSTTPANTRVRLQMDITRLDCDNCQIELLVRNSMNEQFSVETGATSFSASSSGYVSAEFEVLNLQNKIITLGLTCGSCSARTPFDLWCDRRRTTAGFEHGLAFFQHGAGAGDSVTPHPPRMVRPNGLGSDVQLLDSKSNLGRQSLRLTDPSHMLSAPPSAINPNPRVNPQWTLIFSASFDSLSGSPQTVVSAGLDVDNAFLGQVNNSRWHCASTGAGNYAPTTQNINPGDWHLLGCSYDRYDSGRMTAIFDGNYAGSTTLPLTAQMPFLEHGGLDFNTRQPRYNQAQQEAGNVVIDNVMFFPRLLSAEELQEVADMIEKAQQQGPPGGGGGDGGDDARPGLDIDV